MVNPLHNLPAEWIGDGSEESSLKSDGNTLFISSSHMGTPYNIRYDVHVPEYYIEATLIELDGHFSIGVVNPQEMKPGYACCGMYFNGNLHNAQAALKTSWGPHIKQGDVLGVRTKKEGDLLEVAFYRNGVCLGIGFRIAGITDIYQPCLHMDGTATVIISTPENLPSLEKTTMEEYGVEGDWKLVQASNEDKHTLIIPDDHDIIMTVTKDDISMNFSIHVVNCLRTSATILETKSPGHIVQVGVVMSTKMMGPPHLMAVESFVSASLPNVTVVVEADSSLTMGGFNVKMLWKRHTKLTETLTTYKH